MATSLTDRMSPASLGGGAGGRRGPTGLAPPAMLAESSSYDEEPWDEGGGRGSGGGYSDYSAAADTAGSSGNGRRSYWAAGPAITSSAGGAPTASSTAAAAAALAAASGGPAPPSADVGIEVSPTAGSIGAGAGGRQAQAHVDPDAAAEQQLRSRSPFMACVDDTSALFGNGVNCGDVGELAAAERAAEEEGELPSLSIPAHRKGATGAGETMQQQQQRQSTPVGGRVVTVGGRTSVTTTRSLSPPSNKGVRGIIEDSQDKAEPPSPLSQRKQAAFFNQLDDDGDNEGGARGGGRRDGYYDDDELDSRDNGGEVDDMPDDELSDRRGTTEGDASTAASRGAGRSGNSNAVPGGTAGSADPQRRAALDEGIEIEEKQEGGVMSGLARAMSDICSLDGSKQQNGAAAGAGAGTAKGEDAIVADQPGFEMDICAYLHNVCGDLAVANDEPPPPPPPLLPAAAASSNGDEDNNEPFNTSINGKAAQLRLPPTSSSSAVDALNKSTDQQENTAIEVEYVDPDMYSSDEEGSAPPGDAGKKKKKKSNKKKGLGGLGLGKMFGKSKKKVRQDVEAKNVPDATKEKTIAAAAATTTAAAAALMSAAPRERPQDAQRATGAQDDVSQETAGRFEDSDDGEESSDDEPGVVPAPIPMPVGEGNDSAVSTSVDDDDEEAEAVSSTGWSASKKNAYLEAMAARAKNDYRQNSTASPRPADEDSALPGGQKEDDDAAAPAVDDDDNSVPEDDYAEWRPSEKRRFLQLLSSGKSPREAARIIKNARIKATEQAGVDSFESKEESATAAEEETPEAAADATSPTQEDGKNDAVNGGEDPGLGTRSSISEGDKEVEDDGKMNHKMVEAATALAAGAVAIGAAASITSSQDGPSAKDQVEYDAIATAEAEKSLSPEAMAALSRVPEEEDVPTDRLNPTGLNYYDAVRRDDPRDFDDVNVNDVSMVSSEASANKTQDSAKSKRSIMPVSLKSRGFESLDKVPAEDEDTSEVLSDNSQKKSNFMALSSRLLAGKRKEGFSSLPSDGEEEASEDGDSPTANARNLRRARKNKAEEDRAVPGDGAVPLTGKDEDDQSVGEHSTSSASLSAAIMMLRKKPTGFQRMPSEKEGIEEDDEGGDGTSATTVTQTRDLQQAEGEDQPRSSDRIAGEEKKEHHEGDEKDDDSLFNFEEDDTVAIGASTVKPQPSANGDGDIGLTPSSDMSVVSGLTMNTFTADSVMDRSAATAATSATTKSTRRRHHGAAKNRLSKAKQAEGSVAANNVGWLDSIRAAAAKNNRAWDPHLGWVDYTEPESQSNVLDDTGDAKRIGPLPLRKVRKHSEGSGNDELEYKSAARAVVPFPPEWEKERDAMIEESFEANISGDETMNKSDIPPVDEKAPPSVTKEMPLAGEEELVSMNEKSLLIGDDSQVNISESSIPLVVSPKHDWKTDERTVASGLTAQTGMRTHEGTAHMMATTKSTPEGLRAHDEAARSRKATPEKSKPVGWHESMKAAAASVSAKDPTRRWDPQQGWVGLPPEAMPATQKSDTAQEDIDQVLEDARESMIAAAASLTPEAMPATQESYTAQQDLDKVLEDIVSADDVGTRCTPVEDSSLRESVDDSYASRRSGPIDVDEVSDEDEDEGEEGRSKMEEHEEEGGEEEEGGNAKLGVNDSRVSTRSCPVDLDDSDFGDSTDEEDAGDGGQTLGARGVIMSQPKSQQSQDRVSGQDKSRDGLYQFIASSSPEMKSSADGASDEAVGSAKKEPNLSQSTAKPSKLDFSKLPRIGKRTSEAVQQGYDELASVDSERQTVGEESPQANTANKMSGDKSNVVMTTHKEVYYEQFNWERNTTSDAVNAKESSVRVAPQKTVENDVDVKEGEAEASTTELDEDKSTAEVKVVKLKMSEKDKDLFNTNEESSINYIDDTNFAPDFADESPFGTPSRPSKSREIEACGAEIDETSWDDAENVENSFKGAESSNEAQGRPSKSRFLQVQEKRRQQELDDSPDPPSSAPDPPSADVARKDVDGSAGAAMSGAARVSTDGSITTATTGLQGEDISLIGNSSSRGGPSVSSRAKLWMDLMESKSKSHIPSKNDRSLEGRPPSTLNVPRNGSQDEDNYSTDDLETKSKTSSFVEWPGLSGTAAGRSKQAGTEEWKSFLGKKAQAETAAANKKGLVFSTADETPEAQMSGVSVGASESERNKSRGVASSGIEEDSTFKFDGKYDATERTQLKAELEKMSSSKHRSPKLSAYSEDSDGRDDSAQSDIDRTDDGSEKGEKMDRSTFFQRLSACAAPILPRAVDDKSEEVPAAHLKFMKTAACPTEGSQKLLKKLPPSFCGRPDTIFEEGKGKDARTSRYGDQSAQRTSMSPSQQIRSTSRSSPLLDSKQSSRSSPGEGIGEARASTSSVVSGDGFGAKSAYLEAIALKAATKKSKKKGGRSSSSVASSSASSCSSRPPSEAWQLFVERRSSKDATSKSGDSAEHQAAKKVEEMMAAMSKANASKGEIDDMIDSMSIGSSTTSKPQPDSVERSRSSGNRTTKKSETAKAAEELAAARVEAMMAAMSSAKLDKEGEI